MCDQVNYDFSRHIQLQCLRAAVLVAVQFAIIIFTVLNIFHCNVSICCARHNECTSDYNNSISEAERTQTEGVHKKYM